MKVTSRFGPWRPVLGVLAIGAFAFSLTLEGAPVNKGRENSERDTRSYDKSAVSAVPSSASPMARISAEGVSKLDASGRRPDEGVHVARAGRLPAGQNIPVAPKVTVNPYTDEATILRNRGEIPWGPYILPKMAVAGGVCRFAIDCDDCNPCTTDDCNILAFQPSGTCIHTPVPNGAGSGACSDGLFCNGLETCQGGVCELGGAGTGIAPDPENQIPCEGVCAGGSRNGQRCEIADPDCPSGGTCVAAVCNEDEAECVVPCTQRTCAGGTNAGKVCAADGECTPGTCPPVAGATNTCSDGLNCTGTDSCNIGTGVCERTGNPCGPGADCSELTCPGVQGQACNGDAQCPQGAPGDCANRSVAGCFFGRCCESVAGPGNFNCPSVERWETAPNGQPGGRCAAENAWFATAGGGILAGNTVCPACPKYGSGIADADEDEFGPFVVTLGPVSQSSCGGLLALGDDYAFSNGSHVEVAQLVFSGGVETVAEERISFEFYDATGAFIEDIFFVSGSGIAVRVIEIDPPITMPPSGRVIARVATAFAPSGRIFWSTTDEVDSSDGQDVGSNSAATLYVDTTDDMTNNLVAVDFAGVCVGGVHDGEFCGNNEACGSCVGGVNIGDPCDANPDCPGSTCNIAPCDQTIANILAFELSGEKTGDPIGGCCNKSTGVCSQLLPWACEALLPSGGIFLGEGQDCTCAGGVNDGQVCPPAVCTGGTCSAVGCTTGACCNAGACTQVTQGSCTGGGGTFLGSGTDCDPNCCVFPQNTGGDNCDSPGLDVHVINVPCTTDSQCSGGVPGSGKCINPGADGVCYVTITGNNAGATGPDSCVAAQFDPTETQDLENVDPGWWESFSVNDCAFVRLDMCCANPLHAPQWVVMWNECPCEVLGAESFFNSANPHPPFDDLPAGARGAPFCDDDNLWWQYGPLPADTYYQPIYSALAGAHGAYQMHITVRACPKAACCYLECVGGANNGQGCDLNADCPGGACNPLCQLLDILDCENSRTAPVNPGKAGHYIGPPNRATANVFCDNVGPPDETTCGKGSCCPGPGICIDEETGVGDEIIKSECDALGGIYKGGLNCFGGTCSGGSRDGLSCNDGLGCPLGVCAGTEDELAQVSPCPVCDIADDAHCQHDPGAFVGTAYASDESVTVAFPPNNPNRSARVADDFVALESGSISSVCVIGTYLGFDDGRDCAAEFAVPPDNFTVAIYQGDPTVGNALPGTLLGSRATTVVARGLEFGTPPGRTFWRAKLQVSPAIGGLVAGNTYWLEVFNNTTAPPLDCAWFLLNAAEGQGNSYFMQDIGRDYGAEDAAVPLAGRPDAAFCLNLANMPPPEPVRACCACSGAGGTAGGDPNCTDATFYECRVEDKQRWVFDEVECAGFTCDLSDEPVNDECLGALPLVDGQNTVGNRCATNTPAPLNTVQCEGDDPVPPPTRFDDDVWFEYIATCPLAIQFDLCELQNSQDTVVAVYSNGTSTCPCPVTAANQIGNCADDGCAWGGTGSRLTIPAGDVGDCYVVRLAGFADDDGAEFENHKLTVTCGAETPLPEPGPGDDTCQTATGPGTATPCTSNADCSGGEVCGIKSRYLAITPSNPGSPTSIRVEILAMKECAGGVNVARGCETNAHCPGSTCINSPRIGQVWWAGPEVSLRNVPQPALRGSPLECVTAANAHAQTWTTGVLYLYGPPIVPSAQYGVKTCDENGDNCSTASRVVATGDWGDIVRAFGGPSQPGFGDINEVIFKFRELGSALPMPRVDLVGLGNPGQPNTPNQFANFGDIGGCVEGFRGLAYPGSVPACAP